MIRDLLITAAELAALITAFFLLHVLVNLVFQGIAASRLNHDLKIGRYRRKISILLFLSCTALCLLVLGINGFLIYQGKSVLETQLSLIRTIPDTFWIAIATGFTKCVILLLLVKFSLPLVHQLFDWGSRKVKDYDQIKANDESIGLFFTFFKRIVSTGIWGWAVLLCAQFLQLPAIISGFLYTALGIYLIVAVGILTTKMVPVVIDTLDALSDRFAESDPLLKYYSQLRHLIPLLKRCLEYIIYVGTAAIALQSVQVVAWLAPYTYRVIGIIAVFFACQVFVALTTLLIDLFVLGDTLLTDTQRQRRLTVAPLLKSFLKYVIYFGGIVTMLGLIQIDPTPILAGAGIVGIAVGFGAQNLINDVVCGFLILFENYYLVGDYVQMGKEEERSIEGVVEAIELRTTHVRHPDGQLQIIRNGDIGSVVNYSKQYIYATVEVPISSEANLDQVYSLIETVGKQLKADCTDVIEATQIDGLEALSKQNLLLRTLTKSNPGKHLYVQRLLRERLKRAFDRAEIALDAAED